MERSFPDARESPIPLNFAICFVHPEVLRAIEVGVFDSISAVIRKFTRCVQRNMQRRLERSSLAAISPWEHTVAFMGTIPAGTKVTVTLQLDFSASGTTLLMAAYAPNGGVPIGDSAAVAPGGSGSFTIAVAGPGTFGVGVDMTDNNDTGFLSVDPGMRGAKVVGDADLNFLVV